MIRNGKTTKAHLGAIKGALSGERISIATHKPLDAIARLIDLLRYAEINNYTFLCVDGDYYFHINSGVIFIAKQK